jgi:hypothetical protein
MTRFRLVPPEKGHLALGHGLAAGAATSGLVIVALYSVVAYTRDIRARIPFLLGTLDFLELLQLCIGFGVVGLCGLAVAGGWSWRSVAGVGVAAVAATLLLESGVGGLLIPVTYESGPQLWALALGVGGAAWTLAAARARARKWSATSRQAA